MVSIDAARTAFRTQAVGNTELALHYMGFFIGGGKLPGTNVTFANHRPSNFCAVNKANSIDIMCSVQPCSRSVGRFSQAHSVARVII